MTTEHKQNEEYTKDKLYNSYIASKTKKSTKQPQQVIPQYETFLHSSLSTNGLIMT